MSYVSITGSQGRPILDFDSTKAIDQRRQWKNRTSAERAHICARDKHRTIADAERAIDDAEAGDKKEAAATLELLRRGDQSPEGGPRTDEEVEAEADRTYKQIVTGSWSSLDAQERVVFLQNRAAREMSNPDGSVVNTRRYSVVRDQVLYETYLVYGFARARQREAA